MRTRCDHGVGACGLARLGVAVGAQEGPPVSGERCPEIPMTRVEVRTSRDAQRLANTKPKTKKFEVDVPPDRATPRPRAWSSRR
eukprot:4806961-Prymnesium_polylepis.1